MFARCASQFVRRFAKLLGLLVMFVAAGQISVAGEYVPQVSWPTPTVIEPGTAGSPPSDAVVLFDGKDMSQWNNAEQWGVADGAVTAGGSNIQSKAAFGDCQVHLEWAEPEKIDDHGQGRGNSGLYLMGFYELQILDNFQNKTYPDGQCGAIYKQHPPLVNACRKPGQWQAYDVIFERPHFDASGVLIRPAFITVLQNGVVVQNHFPIEGRVAWDRPAHYEPHADRLPIQLQYHNNPVRFRNIWVREMKPMVSRPEGVSGQPASVLPNLNTLTEAEKAAGWQLLFNGQDLAGWRCFRGQGIAAGWKAIDGALCRVNHQADDIVTEGQFDNFILEFDYQMHKQANSGVMYRVSEDEDRPWKTGVEMQLLDNRDAAADAQKSGWAYDLYPAPLDPQTNQPLDATKPAGQWNHVKLVCRGPHIEHWINGVKYFEYELGSADFTERVSKSKFATMPKFAKNPSGHLALQGDHGNVCFANLKLLPLK